MKSISFSKALELLNQLCEIANETTNNKYTIIDFAFGFIPFKNDKNCESETTYNYISIAHWLLNEIENNSK